MSTEKIEKLLEMLISGIEKGSDLASSEAPVIMEQIVALGITQSSIGIVLFFGALVISYRTIKKMHGYDLDEGVNGFYIVISIVTFTVSAAMLPYLISEFITACAAPKVYVIQYLKGLL